MWSFAILLWELATRQVPFSRFSPMEIGMKVCVSATYTEQYLFSYYSTKYFEQMYLL